MSKTASAVTATTRASSLRRLVEYTGRTVVRGLEELGYAASLLAEGCYWLVAGPRRRQPVQLRAVFREARDIGVNAIPITAVLTFTVGMMLAIQGIETLRTFGAEAQVVLGIALSITREFACLIVAIVVAGRSGSAVAARIGTMVENQEIDALRVIGINPVRHLAAPVIIAMLVMVPALTVLGDITGLLGGGIYAAMEMELGLGVYAERSLDVLQARDILQGLFKSVVFGLIIALVGLINGFQVRGGAEGVGRATTRSVVMAISLILVTDLIFTWFMNR